MRSRRKEKMKEEGRKVAEMGGLHIVGTERHEARRIDNQLRGRAGRQGDPGSQPVLPVAARRPDAHLRRRVGRQRAARARHGGRRRPSRAAWSSRRIEAAQKKVEERNFDIRKNLLEYDEVMDHQRKRVYGYRQEILDGDNCKIAHPRHDRRADRRWPSSASSTTTTARRASPSSRRNRLGVEFDAADFARSDFDEAEQIGARQGQPARSPTQIQEAMDENLGADDDASEWNWQALAQPGQRALRPED